MDNPDCDYAQGKDRNAVGEDRSQRLWLVTSQPAAVERNRAERLMADLLRMTAD